MQLRFILDGNLGNRCCDESCFLKDRQVEHLPFIQYLRDVPAERQPCLPAMKTQSISVRLPLVKMPTTESGSYLTMCTVFLRRLSTHLKIEMEVKHY